MANLSYTDTCRNNQLDEITAAIGSSGFLRIYDGSQPADADTAISGQTLLAECPLSATPPAQRLSADVTTRNCAAVFDGDVSTVAAGTGDLQLDSTSITATQVVNIDSLTITEGNA